MLSVEMCGQLGDRCGRTVTVQMPGDRMSVAALLAALTNAHPSLAEAIAGGRVRACVNETIVANEAEVKVGDVVALFPPVSGG